MAYDAELAERIRDIVAAEPGLSEMKMFGGLAFLVGGHMAVAASGQGGLLLRVDPAQTDELLIDPQAAPFVMRGKAMPGWLRVELGASSEDAELAHWVELGVGYARSLPPK